MSFGLRRPGAGFAAVTTLAFSLSLVSIVAAPPSSAQVVDATSGGDPDFFWLPPTVATAPTPTGPFDAGALGALAVEICQLDPTGACVAGPPVARFTSVTKPRITRDTAGELYTVDWQTGAVNRDPLYRGRVLEAGVELGFVDVDLAGSARELASIDSNRYLAKVAGQKVTFRFRVQQPTARTRVRVNEVESNGGDPGDWAELYNTATVPLSLAGYIVRDNDDTHTATLPAGAEIPGRGYYVVEESALGFGLGGNDAVRLFAPDGTTVVDSYAWAAHAPTTYGRCPSGTGAFAVNTTSTKGAANDCTVVIRINEVESSGGTPGDWVELFNPGPGPADLSGWTVRDNDDTHVSTLPAGSTIAAGGYLIVEEAALGFGLGAADSVRLYDPATTLYETYSWTAHASTTYGRCPNGTGAFTTTTSVTKAAANDCGVPVRINEVESSGGTPGDWVELVNPTTSPVDVSGFVLRDNDDTHSYAVPSGTSVAAGGYLVIEEAALGFGLGAADSARLFGPTGALVDSYTWTAHATTTYGRCPNGSGAFTTTTASTKGLANACPGAPSFLPWPGGADVQTADGLNVFGGNLSGLAYEGSGGATPGVLWGARNGPGALFRLVFDGSIWTPDPANDWGAGKTLLYPGGTGSPDAEGVTFAGPDSSGGLYVATERDNNASGVSRNSILRFDAAAAGTSLTASREWNLTADLPVVGPNLGMEAVTWIPDSFLVARGFFDESRAHAYNPAEHADHGSGLFFVGIEANGQIYAYALDHVGGGFTRVATISSGFSGVMALEFDRDLNDLWAVCDDGCLGRSAVLRIDAVTGRFVVIQAFERPGTMPNLNNEGFAIASQSECVGNRKPVFWADDSETGGHAIRRGTLGCTPV